MTQPQLTQDPKTADDWKAWYIAENQKKHDVQTQVQALQLQLQQPIDFANAIRALSARQGMSRIKAPLSVFAGGPNDDVDNWLFLAECMFKADNTTDQDKVIIIAGYLREVALESFRLWTANNALMYWADFKTKMISLFRPHNQQLVLRYSLDDCKMTGTFKIYLNKFQSIISKVQNMGDLDQVHCFLNGLSPKLAMEVGLRNPITLQHAIQIATEWDQHFPTTSSRPSTFNGATPMEVNYVRSNQFFKDKEYKKYAFKKPYTNNNKSAQFNNKQKTCFNCKKPGHFAKDCRAPKTSQINTSIPYMAKRTPYKGTRVYMLRSEKSRLISLNGTLNGNSVSFVVDSGADQSIIAAELVQQYNFSVLPCVGGVIPATGIQEKSLGVTVPLEMALYNVKMPFSFRVMKMRGAAQVLLGLDWFDQAQVMLDYPKRILHFPSKSICLNSQNEVPRVDRWIPEIDYDARVFSAEEQIAEESSDIEQDEDWEIVPRSWVPSDELSPKQKNKFQQFMEKNKEAFASSYKSLGCCNVRRHHIDTGDAQPVFQHQYRRSQKEHEEIEKEVLKMLKANIIRPSYSPWSSNAVLITKKDGTKRFCVDYKKLNNVTVFDRFPLPRIDDILDRLRHSTWFSVMDLKSGYWQVEMDSKSIAKTAFSTAFGHYEFLRLPFGLRNAPSDFSRIMYMILGSLSYVQVYMDDIIVHSKAIEEHFGHIQDVFERLGRVCLKINAIKCEFFQRTIFILGHIVHDGFVEMDPKKTSAVRDMLAPQNIKQLQRLIGMCGYYRRFIKDFAQIVSPLYDLLKKQNVWSWGAEQEAAFSTLKEKLTSEPILRLPDLERPFILYTDASGVALGAILSQIDDAGDEYVIQYASKLLKGAELNYGISEKECYAGVWALKQFRVYLLNCSFNWVTDHKPNEYLETMDVLTGKLFRWGLEFNKYQYKVIYKPGKTHTNVDILTRLPVMMAETVELNVSQEEDGSYKTLDPYEDEALLHFFKHRSLPKGLSSKRCKRVQKLAEVYTWENSKIFYKKKVLGQERKLEVPVISERMNLVINAHLLGHFQVATTLERLQEKYFWKSMEKDVNYVVKRCQSCQRNNIVRINDHPAKALTIRGVLDRVGIDLVFGFPQTTEGYKGILVITEYLTKFPYAVAIKSKSAEEIANHLFLYITLFGPPQELLSDQGTEFLNALVHSLSTNTGIERRVTSPYHPRTNGLTEKFNFTLVSAIRKHTEDDPMNWHKWIPYVLMAYRTRVHSSTGFTPYEMMFGRKMNHFENWTTQTLPEDNLALVKRSAEIKDMIETTHPKAKRNIESKQTAQKKQQDKNSNVVEITLRKGTRVMVRSMRKYVGKLEPKYRGPFTIDGITAKENYWVKNDKNERLDEAIPFSRLKVIDTLPGEDIQESCEVERILRHEKRNGILYYEVKWKGFDNTHNTWEKEANFDTLGCIEDYWSQLHGATGSSPSFFLQSIHVIITVMFILFQFLPMGHTLELTDNFKFCKSSQNDSIIDLSYDCSSTVTQQLLKDQIYHILSKKKYEVHGMSYVCQMSKQTTYWEEDFWGFHYRYVDIEYVKLSRQDCLYMAETKRCHQNAMECVDNSCIYDQEPGEQWHWMAIKHETVYHCNMYRELIQGKTQQEPLFRGEDGACFAKDLYCHSYRKSIIWNQDIIHPCLYELVQTTIFTSIGNVHFTDKESLLLKSTNQFFDCGIQIFETSSGLYMSQDNASALLEKSEFDISTMEELILSDLDYKVLSMHEESMQIQKSLLESTCKTFFTMLKTSAFKEDEFYVMDDFRGKEIILYANQGILFSPTCEHIPTISIQHEEKRCFVDIPIQFIIGITTQEGFLSKNLVIQGNSSSTDVCFNIISLSHGKVLIRSGQNYSVQFFKIKELTLDNIKDNLPNYFQHDSILNQGVDMYGLLNNISIMRDIQESMFISPKHQDNTDTESMFSNIGPSIAVWIHRFWNILAGIIILAILIAIIGISILITRWIRSYLRRRKHIALPPVAFNENDEEVHFSRDVAIQDEHFYPPTTSTFTLHQSIPQSKSDPLSHTKFASPNLFKANSAVGLSNI